MSTKNSTADLEAYAAEQLTACADRLVARLESGGLDPAWARDARTRLARAGSACGGRDAAVEAFLSDSAAIGPSTDDEETLWDAAWLEALRAALDVVRGDG